MPDFAALIPETYHNISADYVETLLGARCEERFTGLMRLSHSTGGNLIFTFLEGVQQRLYRCLEDTAEIVPRQSWLHAFHDSSASIGILYMPVEAVRFTRVAYEAPILRIERSLFSPERLKDAAGKWSAENEAGIVHVQGEKVNRFYLFAGHSSPLIEELSLAEGEARFSINDASFPENLPKADHEVVRYVSDTEHEVWREYELRLAFSPLMRMLLNRFGELTGRVLTERLCQQLSVWALEGGWNITITSNGAVNRHYFESLESAIEVYVNLLRRFRQEASLAVGSRMVESILREMLMKMDPYRREFLTQYGLGDVAGVVRR